MATVTLEPATSRQSHVYRNARRVLTSIFAPIERRCLIWLARRMPARIASDHLTALARASMIGAGGGYWLARITPAGLWVALVCLALNWFGDSLDGTLARVRGHERPRYGFYVDLAGTAGAVGLFLVFALSAARHARILYLEEPIPHTKPFRGPVV